ncbi:signal peptide peptidase SppA, partial [candidate division WOR-3 bacterium]|nr:signal peptide peptidase SppA [candidate division WOR-3 bacterium]
GLKIVAFAEGYGIGSYYLASVADKIWMVPTGEVSFVGGYARTLHIKGTLDKLGIEPDFYRVGEYKSAYELFEFSQPSDEDKEQLEAYLASLYDEMLGAIGRDRDISRAEFEKFMNERIMVSGDTAKMLGLVDGLCLALDLDSIVKIEFGDNAERIKLADLKKRPKEIGRAWVESRKKSTLTKQDKIALVVAEGDIVTGESGSNPIPIPLIGGKYMGSTTISEALDKVKTDKQIKAVVFRINSGGGSALASEIISRALTELAAEKPVIVSMAGAAASGGYYIAAPADKIFADATTVTGSIGILGGKFVTKGLNEKLGINRETIKLYPHADMFSPDRPFDEEEAALMQRMMDEGYAEFVGRVAEGRGMTFDEVDSVARGRIWSGPDGVKVGLADEVGGLMDALEEARRMAGLPEDCNVVIYPKPEPMIDIEEVLDETSILNLKMLPSWLSENLLYLMPYQIEVPIR